MAFPRESLDELAESIRARGILQPILARSHPTQPERFYIVAGERRWRAAGIAGLHEIPAIVREMSDTEAATAALIENLQREDLNPMEEAEGYSRLLDELRVTQDKLAEALGKSRSHVTNALRLLNLPQSVQDEVRKGNLSFGHARALLAHPNPEAMAGVVRARGLTVRQTEALASRGGAGKGRPGDRPQTADSAALEQRLMERLGFHARRHDRSAGAGVRRAGFRGRPSAGGMGRRPDVTPPAGPLPAGPMPPLGFPDKTTTSRWRADLACAGMRFLIAIITER